MERTGDPYGKKPWLRRDSCVSDQRTVIGDHRDLVFMAALVVAGLAVVGLALLASL